MMRCECADAGFEEGRDEGFIAGVASAKLQMQEVLVALERGDVDRAMTRLNPDEWNAKKEREAARTREFLQGRHPFLRVPARIAAGAAP